MDIDGGNPKELAVASIITSPVVSLDSKWVIYMSVEAQGLWKVPIDGGEPVRLTDYWTNARDVSPRDGQLACLIIDETASPRRIRIALIPIEGGPLTKLIDLPNQIMSRTIRWTSDGRALTYRETRAGTSNIWTIPLDGGQPVQLTDFKSEHIFTYAFSRDGRQLAMARGSETSDVVLISDVR